RGGIDGDLADVDRHPVAIDVMRIARRLDDDGRIVFLGALDDLGHHAHRPGQRRPGEAALTAPSLDRRPATFEYLTFGLGDVSLIDDPGSRRRVRLFGHPASLRPERITARAGWSPVCSPR